jgi:hypothetical protein
VPILTLFRFTMKVMLGRLVGWEPEPLRIRLGGARRTAHAVLFPDGRLLPGVAGGEGDDPDDPDPAPDPDPDPDPNPTPAPDPDPDPTPDPDPSLPKLDGPFDAERARRAMAAERRKTEEERRKRQEAERERDELRQAQESEQERIQRERDEALLEAQTARERADRLLVDNALRDAAIEAGVDPQRVARAVKLADREDIAVSHDGDEASVTGSEDAIATVVADFPEFVSSINPDPDPDPPEDDPVPEPPGGNPDRKRKPKPLTPEQVSELAKKDPAKFNEMWEKGQIPKSALGAK